VTRADIPVTPARARAWVQHLRQGGTTPWLDFPGDAAARGSSVELPGVAQLELARRLNESAGHRTGRAHGELIDRVLVAAAPGRGGQPRSLLDARPVDPAKVPNSELIRIAVGVLADIVTERDPGAGNDRRPRRRGTLVVGPPLAVTATLTTNGLPALPPAHPTRVVVLADELDRALADVWAGRIRSGSTQTWSGFLGAVHGHDRIPPRADAAAIAQRWASRVGADRVHVVFGPGLVHGITRRPFAAAYPVPVRSAYELVREVNAVLRILRDETTHRRLLDQVLWPMVADVAGPPPRLDADSHDWLQRRGERMRDAISSGGYALHGDPGYVVPVDPAERDPQRAAAGRMTVLDVAVRTLLGTREEYL
jgi:hypothetical protein